LATQIGADHRGSTQMKPLGKPLPPSSVPKQFPKDTNLGVQGTASASGAVLQGFICVDPEDH